MPREGVPKDELFRAQTKLQQRAPNNRRSRLGKTVRALCSFARAARLDAGKDVFWLDAVIFLFAEQDALGSHRDSAEMTAPIPKCFADDHQFRFAHPSLKISA